MCYRRVIPLPEPFWFHSVKLKAEEMVRGTGNKTVYVYRNIGEVCAIIVAVEKQYVLQFLSVRL